MSKKIISAGHVCIDITPKFPTGQTYKKISELLVPGKLIYMNGVETSIGGSVANTGLALKKLGVEVALLGKIGDDDFGRMIMKAFESYNAEGLIIDPDGNTSYSVVLAVPGIDRIFLHDEGANATFCSADIPDEMLEDTALFHFGYPPLMHKMHENDGEELVAMYQRVKNKGIATSLDMAAVDPTTDAGRADWQKIIERVMPYVDFAVPSFEEICFMLNRPRYNELAEEGGDMTEKMDIGKDVIPLAQKLLDLGAAAALIKCGSRGMYYRTADRERIMRIGENLEIDADAWAGKEGFQDCFKADRVLSATGAGDTSIAAFLAAVLRGKTPEQAAALAAAEGACAVTTYDSLSGLKSLEYLEERIKRGWTKE